MARDLDGLDPTSSPDASRTLTVRAVRVVVDREQTLGVGDAERARGSRVPAASIGGPPKNCTRASPLVGGCGGGGAVVAVVAARTEEHGTGQRAARRRGTGVARRGRTGGATSGRTYPPPHGRPQSAPWALAGGRRPAGRRGRRRRRRCSTCCATGSATAPRRTAAARRASAAAARCWSTASPGSPASRRRAGCAGRAITTVDGLARRRPRPLGRRVLRHRGQPVRVLHARASCAAWRACGPSSPAPITPPWSRRSSPTCAAAPAGARSSTPGTSCGRRRADPPTATSTPPAPGPPSRRAGRSASRPPSPSARAGSATTLAPPDALVAVPDGAGGWAVGETLAEARARAGKVQGRRTTVDATPPLDVPPGAWAAPLRTTWVEPAYLEPDASWCEPGGEPHTPLANGGAFGGKLALARRRGGRAPWPTSTAGPCGCCSTARTSCASGPKRPPVAGGADAERARRAARRPHAGHRRGHRVGGARPRGRGGRRAGSADLVRPARGRLGRGGRAARRRPRHRSAR